MNLRTFIETSGDVAGAAVLGGVKTTFGENQSGSELTKGRNG